MSSHDSTGSKPEKRRQIYLNLKKVVGPVGLEPTTNGLWVRQRNIKYIYFNNLVRRLLPTMHHKAQLLTTHPRKISTIILRSSGEWWSDTKVAIPKFDSLPVEQHFVGFFQQRLLIPVTVLQLVDGGASEALKTACASRPEWHVAPSRRFWRSTSTTSPSWSTARQR